MEKPTKTKKAASEVVSKTATKAAATKKVTKTAKPAPKKIIKKQPVVTVEKEKPAAISKTAPAPIAHAADKTVTIKKSVAIPEPEIPAKAHVKPTINLMHGVGRRKSAVARVWLQRGRGKLVINGTEYETYFNTEIARLSASHPFRVIAQANNYDAVANVYGGGLGAQADAVKVGFARALLQINSDWRPVLRQAGLLTVDARRKERKKYGRKAARRRFQFVKR